jgi:hypothetical protein
MCSPPVKAFTLTEPAYITPVSSAQEWIQIALLYANLDGCFGLLSCCAEMSVVLGPENAKTSME